MLPLLSLILLLIRPAKLQDAPAIVSMMVQSVDQLARRQRNYSESQVNVWMSVLPSPSRMEQLLMEADRTAWVATKTDDDDDSSATTNIVGYMDLKKSSLIDFLYVHPGRQGIATRLYQEAVASSSSALLTTEASEGAKLFFEKCGFHVVKRREMEIDGVAIHNYHMVKSVSTTLPSPSISGRTRFMSCIRWLIDVLAGFFSGY